MTGAASGNAQTRSAHLRHSTKAQSKVANAACGKKMREFPPFSGRRDPRKVFLRPPAAGARIFPPENMKKGEKYEEWTNFQLGGCKIFRFCARAGSLRTPAWRKSIMRSRFLTRAPLSGRRSKLRRFHSLFCFRVLWALAALRYSISLWKNWYQIRKFN